MARDGVRTLYLQTGNYEQSVDLVRPDDLGRFIDTAHAAGMRVVGWYLPSFASPAQDRRRALADSLYEFPITTRATWTALARSRAAAGDPPCR
jgi:hypothetical protein